MNSLIRSGAENFEKAYAMAFRELGIFKGKIVNLDCHFIGYFGNVKIGKDKHPTRNVSMRGIKAFISQYQETGNPVFARVEYPAKGLKPENITIPMLETTREILPSLEKAVFDKWFMKLIVVKFFEDGVEKYYGYLTNDYDSSEVQIFVYSDV